MKNETMIQKSNSSARIASAVNDMERGYANQFLMVYLSKLSVKDLKQAEKDIKRLDEYKDIKAVSLAIFDRILGSSYDPHDFYLKLMQYDEQPIQAISRAMDAGTEDDVREAIINLVNLSDLEKCWKEVIETNTRTLNWIEC